jgi:uncharacterized delta-60 repeat protein
VKKLILSTIFILNITVYSFAQAGSLDNTFGAGGIVTTDFGNDYADGYSVAIQIDGKIVVAGDDYHTFTVVRYNTDGSLDSTFDSDGKVITVIGTGGADAKSVVIQNDGKIIVAGFSGNGTDWDFTVVRYNSNGSLDNTFDFDGIVTTPIGVGSADYAYSVKLQLDGKIVLAGNSNDDFAMVRYNSDGSLDNTFDSDGKVTTDIGGIDDGCSSMAIQTDGKIILAGCSYTNINTAPSNNALARYNTDGTLDSTFATNGIVTWSMGAGSSFENAIAIQTDGKIVSAGMSYTYITGWDFTLVRLNSDGTFDNSFDSDGKVTTDLGYNNGAYSIAIQNNGKILVAGNANDGGPYSDFALVRYSTDGSLDSTFDFDGIVTTNIGNDDHVHSVALQNDGKILIAGFSNNTNSYDFAVVRYNGDALNGIEENILMSDVKIYPNPSSGIFTVNLKNKAVETKICVYDVLGNCLWKKDCRNDVSPKIDLSCQTKGIYFVELLSGEERVVRKIAIQ